MPDDIRSDVRRLKNAVFGNPDNPKETPGVISELAQMNSTLIELRDSMRRINWTIITAFITALCVLVFKTPNA
jgi:hypothetical protein